MITWYSREFQNIAEGLSTIEKLQEMYVAAIGAGTLPADALIFTRHDRRANMLTLYFSPSAQSFARAVVASRCAQPLRDERLVLAAGDTQFLDSAFLLDPGEGASS